MQVLTTARCLATLDWSLSASQDYFWKCASKEAVAGSATSGSCKSIDAGCVGGGSACSGQDDLVDASRVPARLTRRCSYEGEAVTGGCLTEAECAATRAAADQTSRGGQCRAGQGGYARANDACISRYDRYDPSLGGWDGVPDGGRCELVWDWFVKDPDLTLRCAPDGQLASSDPCHTRYVSGIRDPSDPSSASRLNNELYNTRYVSDLFEERLVKIIETHPLDEPQRLFVYVAFAAMHGPIQVRARNLEPLSRAIEEPLTAAALCHTTLCR